MAQTAKKLLPEIFLKKTFLEENLGSGAVPVKYVCHTTVDIILVRTINLRILRTIRLLLVSRIKLNTTKDMKTPPLRWITALNAWKQDDCVGQS